MKRLMVVVVLFILTYTSCAAQQGQMKPMIRQIRSPHGFVQICLGGVYQTVIAGSRNVLVTWLNFSNSYDWDQNIISIRLRVETAGDVVSWLHNFSLYTDDGRQIRTTNNPDADIATGVDRRHGLVQFDIDPDGIPQFIDGGGKLSLYITFDVSHGIEDNAIVKAILHPRRITFEPVDRRPARIIPARRLVSSEITVLQNGQLLIAESAGQPNDGLLPGLTDGITVMSFLLWSEFEDIKVEKFPLYFRRLNNGGPDQVDTVYFYQGDELITVVQPTMMDETSEQTIEYLRENGRDDLIARIEEGLIPSHSFGYVDITNSPIIVPQDESVTITVKILTSDCQNWRGTKGESGQGFEIHIPGEEIIAKGQSSGRTVLVSGYAQSSEFNLFRSVPVIAPNDQLSSGRVSDGIIDFGTETNKALYAVGISADSVGDVGINRLTFIINTDIVGIENLRLLSPLNEVIGEGVIVENAGGEFILDDDNVVVVDLFEPYEIPRGTTRVLTLIADVSLFGGQNREAFLSTQLLGDPEFPNPLPGIFLDVAGQSWLIWTDFTWTPVLQNFHPDVLTMPQWTNGFRVMTPNGDNLAPRSSAVVFSR